VQRVAWLLLPVLAGGCSSTHHGSPTSQTSVAAGAIASSSTPPTPVTASVPARDPAESATPAAGVCALATGSVDDVRFPPDFVPEPRCLVIRHDQRLSVSNATDEPITAALGTHYKAIVPPHQTHTFADPVGTYLDPGVHRLVFTQSSAADIWVDAVCKGPGATECVTP